LAFNVSRSERDPFHSTIERLERMTRLSVGAFDDYSNEVEVRKGTMRQPQTSAEPNEAGQSFRSNLTTGRERFLAHVIEHGTQIGRRTPEDFLRHFPPMAIMEALREQPQLRAAIITFTTGTKHGVALKKSWESCGEDVRIALEEGETDATSVLAPFALDDRVRFLDAKKLWAFVTEGEFWKVSATKPREVEMARPHVAFMLERALQDKLLTHQDVVDGITVDELAARLPKSELGNVIKLALSNSHGQLAFTERDLLAAVPPPVLVNYIPLTHLWTTVMVQKVAERHAYVDVRDREEVPATTANPVAAISVAQNIAEVAPAELPAPAKAQAPRSAEVTLEKATASNLKPLVAAQPLITAPNPSPQAANELLGVPSVQLSQKAPAKGDAAAKLAASKVDAKAEAPSDVAYKVPAPAKRTSGETIDTMTWSAEVAEGDIVDEDSLLGEDLVEVANS
jgi:hypothetical protein